VIGEIFVGTFCYVIGHYVGWRRGSRGQAEHMLKEYPQLAYWMKLKGAQRDGPGGGE
jgi:hypothetical protein